MRIKMSLDLTNYIVNNNINLNIKKFENIDDTDVAKLFYEGYHNSVDDEGEKIDDWKELVSQFKKNEFGELIYDTSLFSIENNILTSGIIIGKDDNKPYIVALATEPKHRNKGLATSLIKSCANRLKTNHKEFILYVNEDNKKALRLYKNLGFKIVE